MKDFIEYILNWFQKDITTRQRIARYFINKNTPKIKRSELVFKDTDIMGTIHVMRYYDNGRKEPITIDCSPDMEKLLNKLNKGTITDEDKDARIKKMGQTISTLNEKLLAINNKI